MRPLLCSRRCCDPQLQLSKPPWSTNRNGSNKIFCQKLFLSVCGGGRGGGGCVAVRLPVSSQAWVLVGRGCGWLGLCLAQCQA